MGRCSTGGACRRDARTRHGRRPRRSRSRLPHERALPPRLRPQLNSAPTRLMASSRLHHGRMPSSSFRSTALASESCPSRLVLAPSGSRSEAITARYRLFLPMRRKARSTGPDATSCGSSAATRVRTIPRRARTSPNSPRSATSVTPPWPCSTHRSPVSTTLTTRSSKQQLNDRYDRYVAKYGPLNRFRLARTGRTDPITGADKYRRLLPSMGGFDADPDFHTVLALGGLREGGSQFPSP